MTVMGTPRASRATYTGPVRRTLAALAEIAPRMPEQALRPLPQHAVDVARSDDRLAMHEQPEQAVYRRVQQDVHDERDNVGEHETEAAHARRRHQPFERRE